MKSYQLWMLGFIAGIIWQARKDKKAMGKLHDDLLARTKTLLETAKQTVAVGTETQQQMTDVYQQLDQANQLLQQFIQDNAATGSSTGGSERPNTGVIPPSDAARSAQPQQQTKQTVGWKA